MYSLSTCWNSQRHTDGRAMLREIRDLGFEYAELSHGIRLGLMPGILEAVDAGEIKISSLHNFCPLPMGVNHASPNLYEFPTSDRANASWRSNTRSKHRVRPAGQGAGRRAAPRQHGPKRLHRQTDRNAGTEMGLNRPDMKSRPRSPPAAKLKREKPSSAFAKRCAISCPKPKNAALSLASKTARRSRKFRLKATLNFSSTSLTARTWFIGTTPATRKSRKISDSFITHTAS